MFLKFFEESIMDFFREDKLDVVNFKYVWYIFGVMIESGGEIYILIFFNIVLLYLKMLVL